MKEAQLKSVQDIATMFGVSRFGLYKKIRAGEIPAYHFGRKVLVDPTEFREALRRHVGDSQSNRRTDGDDPDVA
jgi:excisionase family DNA binding protein